MKHYCNNKSAYYLMLEYDLILDFLSIKMNCMNKKVEFFFKLLHVNSMKV